MLLRYVSYDFSAPISRSRNSTFSSELRTFSNIKLNKKISPYPYAQKHGMIYMLHRYALHDFINKKISLCPWTEKSDDNAIRILGILKSYDFSVHGQGDILLFVFDFKKFGSFEESLSLTAAEL